MDIDVTDLKRGIALIVIRDRVSAAEVLAELVASCLMCDEKAPHHVDGKAYAKAFSNRMVDRT